MLLTRLYWPLKGRLFRGDPTYPLTRVEKGHGNAVFAQIELSFDSPADANGFIYAVSRSGNDPLAFCELMLENADRKSVANALKLLKDSNQ